MANLQHVVSGDRLRISADDWNAITDATKVVQRSMLTGGSQLIGGNDSNVVSIKNASATDVDRFGILAVTGFLFNPDSDVFNINWQNRISVTGNIPTSGDLGNFAVCLEPIKAGKVGRAAIGGLVPAKVKMLSESDRFADVLDGSGAMLQSGAGTARIRALQPQANRTVADEAWCYIQIGLESIIRPRLRITGSAAVVANIWAYSGIEQSPSFSGGRVRWADKANAPAWSGIIFNDAETNNPATAGVMPSVGFNTADTTPAATYTVLPLQPGLVTPFEPRTINGTTYFIVDFPNAVDVTCG